MIKWSHQGRSFFLISWPTEAAMSWSFSLSSSVLKNITTKRTRCITIVLKHKIIERKQIVPKSNHKKVNKFYQHFYRRFLFTFNFSTLKYLKFPTLVTAPSFFLLFLKHLWPSHWSLTGNSVTRWSTLSASISWRLQVTKTCFRRIVQFF